MEICSKRALSQAFRTRKLCSCIRIHPANLEFKASGLGFGVPQTSRFQLFGVRAIAFFGGGICRATLRRATVRDVGGLFDYMHSGRRGILPKYSDFYITMACAKKCSQPDAEQEHGEFLRNQSLCVFMRLPYQHPRN